jgi:copper resistance protein B
MRQSQRLIPRPETEANLYGQSDDVGRTGSGLSDLEAGLSLRYEFTRQFAPCIGVEWVGKFGRTAAFSGAASEHIDETRRVAGLRLCF